MGCNHNAFGHRGGVALEATVYRELLPSLALSTPWLYGVYEDASSGQVWIILEYLEESVRVKKSPDPTAMDLAARWIGQFHLTSEARLQETEMPFLKPYDAEYYLGWARRTSQYAGHWHQRFPWLQSLCESFEEVVTTLLYAPPTVIHGEYYPKNILFRDGNIYPVDWESTAIAAGVIDLASLTEAWSEDVAHQCEIEYQQARWPDGPPNDFDRMLCAAQLYLNFRWLGNLPKGTTSGWRFRQLHSVGRELGLI
jgi:aminoglycoside phosphotransferase (APT) family kinase protein